MIQRKRIYAAYAADDGARFLVDRLWPRGVAKEAAHLDGWLKVIAPSTALRQAYHQGECGYAELGERYQVELLSQPEAVACLADLAERSMTQTITLVYAARDETQNHVQILMTILQDEFGAACAAEGKTQL